jgi:hypothetical protein
LGALEYLSQPIEEAHKYHAILKLKEQLKRSNPVSSTPIAWKAGQANRIQNNQQLY